MEHTNNSVMRNAFAAYQKSEWTSLFDVYAQPSYDKVRALDYCLLLVNKYNGKRPRIVAYNTFHFSFGFIGDYKGKRVFFYITAKHDRYIYLDELQIV